MLGSGNRSRSCPTPRTQQRRFPREATAKRRRLAPRAPAGCSLSCRNLVPTAGTGCGVSLGELGVQPGNWGAQWGEACTSSRESRYPTSYGATRQGVTGLLRPWAKGAARPGRSNAILLAGLGVHCPLPGKCQPRRSLSPKTARHPHLQGDHSNRRHPQRGHSCAFPTSREELGGTP